MLKDERLVGYNVFDKEGDVIAVALKSYVCYETGLRPGEYEEMDFLEALLFLTHTKILKRR